MQESDLDEILEIERSSFKIPWHRVFFLSDLNRPTSFCLVARADKQIAGYLIAWREGEGFHIANLAVAPRFRRQKIGSRLLSEAIEVSRELGLTKLYLEVRVSNEPAISLYERFGFKLARRRPSYYTDGEDAWVMEYELGG